MSMTQDIFFYLLNKNLSPFTFYLTNRIFEHARKYGINKVWIVEFE